MTEDVTPEQFQLSLPPPIGQLVPLPLPMVLHCPSCNFQHVDEGYWARRLHKTHLCASCRCEWRPCSYPTVGVLVLPPAVKE